MDDKTRNEITKLLSALKALRSSSNNAFHMKIYDEGSANMMIKTYRALHGKIKELLPDDFYITDALDLDLAEDADAKAKVVQVQLASDQLYSYLKDQVKSDWGDFVGFGKSWNLGDEEELKELANMGKKLQTEIIDRTRGALRRALSGLEIEFEKDENGEKTKKAHVEIHIDKDDEDESADEAPRTNIDVENEDDPDLRDDNSPRVV